MFFPSKECTKSRIMCPLLVEPFQSQYFSSALNGKQLIAVISQLVLQQNEITSVRA